jgi:ferredoxin
VRVHVDAAKCKAYGICYQQSPEVFDLDDSGYASVRMEEVPPELHEAARMAVRMCPERAISIEAG